MVISFSSRKVEWLMVTLIALSYLLSAVFSQIMYDNRVAARDPAESLPSYLLPIPILEKLSFGFRTLAADILWIGAIQFYVEWDRKDPTFIQYFDSIVALDQKFEYPYLFGTLILPEGDPGMEQTRRIAEKGIAALPNDWQIPFYLGMQYHTVLHDISHALKYINLAADTPGAPGVVKDTRAFYAVRAGDYSAGKTLLETLYKTADNQYTKDLAQRKLELLSLLETLQKAVLSYKKQFGTFPSSVDDLVSRRIIPVLPPELKGFRFEIDPNTGRITFAH
ncbi:MAG: hypothetical protein A3H69_05245 [Candidatus Sungbacteria bacterium RIFCSPLOWO2_02_FULL_47_9]|nr:MAG: hypothetical protein UX72_C0008G0027 [Parcubacteria group bacterium GW2011_GWA2_47_10]OHA10101.1 MAG: hypothetical protein A3H69_05245 [Candidatus Sungbacteria bacterium RIFCSPLOWO2_02_FULL_47_9]